MTRTLYKNNDSDIINDEKIQRLLLVVQNGCGADIFKIIIFYMIKTDLKIVYRSLSLKTKLLQVPDIPDIKHYNFI